MPPTAPPTRSRFSSRLSRQSSIHCAGSSSGWVMVLPGEKRDVVFGRSVPGERGDRLAQPLDQRRQRQVAGGAQDAVEPPLAEVLAGRRPAFGDAVGVQEDPAPPREPPPALLVAAEAEADDRSPLFEPA